MPPLMDPWSDKCSFMSSQIMRRDTLTSLAKQHFFHEETVAAAAVTSNQYFSAFFALHHFLLLFHSRWVISQPSARFPNRLIQRRTAEEMAKQSCCMKNQPNYFLQAGPPFCNSVATITIKHNTPLSCKNAVVAC